MTKSEAKKRIEKLKKAINHHRYLYHVLNSQEISQEALDSLKHELYKLEQQFPQFITPDSPTQRVAGEPLKGFKKAEHKTPMLSLEDIFSEKELQDWENYLKRLAPSFFTKEEKREYFCEQKVDGFAVELIYEKGVLRTGSTRGNGFVGEDVIQNLKTIESIPLYLEKPKIKKDSELGFWDLEFPPARLEVRGEVYMERADFEKLNKKLEKKGEKTYSNPRNLAAGSIRQLDPKLAARRPLKFLAYDLVTNIGQTKHSQEHKALSFLGFKVDKGKICKNLSEVLVYWQETLKKRQFLPFQIDGIVVGVNDNLLFKKLGIAGKSPRGARAFKFSPKQATSRILEIKFQVGRTGAITPVALLEPVEIDGVTISRATLHNQDEMKKLGVMIGDTVIVERAGDVIPGINKVLPELRTGKEKKAYFPKVCPVCQSELIRSENEAIWRCFNPKCFARQKKYFYHFISRGAFNIVGLGHKIIDKLIDKSLVSDPADLFRLKPGDVLPLEGFAQKSAQNLISAIQSRKKIALPRFIYALGIRNIGQQTAQSLARHFGSIENLKNASFEKLQQIRDIGPIAAKSINDWFAQKRNLEFLEKLKKAGIEIKNLKLKAETEKLKNLTFVLTGAFETMTREEVVEKIRFFGGNVSESISQKTKFLLLGKNPGSKFDKAKKTKEVKIIGEKEFLEMIK